MSGKLDFTKVEKQRYFIRSIAKGLAVLKTIADNKRPLSLSEISKNLHFNKTTSTRLCYTLSELGYINKDSHGKYYVTPNVLRLGSSCIINCDWRQCASSILENLFNKINETVNLTLLDDLDVIYIVRIKQPNFLTIDLQLGSAVPVHCSSSGKLFLALTAEEKKVNILKNLKLRPITSQTIINMNDLENELEIIKSNGYAISDEEMSIGTIGLAVPVKNSKGDIIAAINTAVSSTNFNPDEVVEKYLGPLLNTAEELAVAWQNLNIKDFSYKDNS